MPWHLHTPSLRHCRISPPEDMFFSASISLKLSELAKTSTSTMAISRVRKITAVSDDMPCVASMPSISVWQRHTIIKNTKGTVWCHSRSVNTFCYNADHSLSSVQRWNIQAENEVFWVKCDNTAHPAKQDEMGLGRCFLGCRIASGRQFLLWDVVHWNVTFESFNRRKMSSNLPDQATVPLNILGSAKFLFLKKVCYVPLGCNSLIKKKLFLW